jgi:hypothetical protein
LDVGVMKVPRKLTIGRVISGLGLGIGKRRVKPPKDCYSSITPAVQNIAEDHR